MALELPKRAMLLWVAMLTLAVSSPPAWSAQDEKAAPVQLPTSRGEARDMVATLSDEEVRQLLLEHLDRSLPEAATQTPVASVWLLTESDRALERLVGMVEQSRTLGSDLNRLASSIRADMHHPWLALLGTVLLCFTVGGLIERFMLRPSGILGGLNSIAGKAVEGNLTASQVLLGAGCRSLGAILFLAGSVLALSVTPSLSDGVRALASTTIWLAAGTRLVSTAIRALLLPSGGQSPWPISRPVARAVARHLGIVTAFVLVNALDDLLLKALGASDNLLATIRLFDSTLLIGSILVAIFAVRREMAPEEMDDHGVIHLLRQRWHIVAAGYVIVTYVLAIYAALVTTEMVFWRALGSFCLILVIPVADYGLRLLAARLAPAPAPVGAGEPVLPPQEDDYLDTDGGDEEEAAPETVPPERDRVVMPGEPPEPLSGTTTSTTKEASTIEAAILLNLRVLLGLTLFLTLGAFWEISPFRLISELFGDEHAAALTRIAISTLFAFILWQIVKAALAAHSAPESEGFDLGGDGGAAGQTRVQTLMPLIAKTIGIVLLVMIALIALSSFGVNIGPLLAGAGVVGLAVGFGAQTLVKDIVSGVFFLVDDAFRMGEYLSIDNIRGTVEKISVRSLRLRHHRGPLHTLPYGEIKSITNYSRDYAIMKFEVRVPFETDVEMVRKLIKQVGAELAENEELASVMLEPLKSQGVNRMDDSAFVIRCKFTTLPGKQFTVRRVAYAKIQEAFAREGIHFAPKRVVVETVAPAGSTEALAAAAAAAQSTLDEPPRRASGDDR